MAEEKVLHREIKQVVEEYVERDGRRFHRYYDEKGTMICDTDSVFNSDQMRADVLLIRNFAQWCADLASQ